MSSRNAVHKGIPLHESQCFARPWPARRRQRLADLALDDAQLSSAFAQLLGARFTPAQSGTLPPAALSADDESAPPLSRNQLNQLLAALGERGALLVNALPASAENAVDATAKKRIRARIRRRSARRKP